MDLAAALTRRLPAPVLRELTRRSLWGYFPRRQSPPPGPPRLALSFDLDYQADTDALPALVELMAAAEVRSTLFCIGALVGKDPAPYRDAARAGHAIANHTQTHPDNPVLNPDQEFWDLSVEAMVDEIARAQDTLAAHTGRRPIGFRSPHFKDAFRMMHALERFPEIRYVSTALASKSPCAQPYYPTRTPFLDDLGLHYPGTPDAWPRLMIPLTPSPEYRWSPFCSYSSIRRPSNPATGAGLQSIAQWERSWARMLRRAKADKFASVYFDPMDVMRDEETRPAFRRMLEHARSEGWEITTLERIASVWSAHLEAAPKT